MSQFVETPTKSFTAGGAISQYLRVSLSSGSLAASGADDPGIGILEEASFAANDVRSVRLWTAQGTRKMVASGSISSGARVYAAASGKIASSGAMCLGVALEAASTDGNVIEVLPSHPLSGTVRSIRTRVTTAQVNAGYTLLTAIPGVKYRVVDMSLISIGGNASGATTIDILATQSSSSVKLLAAAVAGLTQSTLLRAGASNATILADGVSFVQNDANTAITIGKTGSSLATSTHIDVLLTYVLES